MPENKKEKMEHDTYEKFCKERFSAIETLIGQMREKIFNGFGRQIELMEKDLRSQRTMLWGLVSGLLLVFGALVANLIIK
jgi:hypothetical protein